jgi:peptidoglycan-N-acetylglucosamine deacetylase
MSLLEKNNYKLIVTTSWDDGTRLDLRLADLLNKYDLRGTFYIPRECELGPLLAPEEIKLISQTQEIGAHTLSHRYLNEIGRDEVKGEIAGSKEFLEEIINKPVNVFCYPGGCHTGVALAAVKEAGFIGGRAVNDFTFDLPQDNFCFGTTLQVYPFPFRFRVRSGRLTPARIISPLLERSKNINKFKLPLNSFLSWSYLAKNIFDYSLKNGQVFHLWGHSWEIDYYGMWDELEDFFEYIAHRSDCEYLTNSEVLNLKR